MTARVRQIGDPILRDVSVLIDVSEIPSKKIQALIERMQSILDGIQAISNQNGNALSAPQVGCLVRLIVLRIDGVFYPMINPTFEPVSDKKFDFEEECFSLYDQRATVSRYHEIDLTYLDENTVTKRMRLQGEESGLVQHEIDHLDGVLFIDHVQRDKLQTIDLVLGDNPVRLAQVKTMMAYMAEDI